MVINTLYYQRPVHLGKMCYHLVIILKKKKPKLLQRYSVSNLPTVMSTQKALTEWSQVNVEMDPMQQNILLLSFFFFNVE